MITKKIFFLAFGFTIFSSNLMISKNPSFFSKTAKTIKQNPVEATASFVFLVFLTKMTYNIFMMNREFNKMQKLYEEIIIDPIMGGNIKTEQDMKNLASSIFRSSNWSLVDAKMQYDKIISILFTCRIKLESMINSVYSKISRAKFINLASKIDLLLREAENRFALTQKDEKQYETQYKRYKEFQELEIKKRLDLLKIEVMNAPK